MPHVCVMIPDLLTYILKRKDICLPPKELRRGCEAATAALTKAEQSAEAVAHTQAQLATKAAEVVDLQSALESTRSQLAVRLTVILVLSFYLHPPPLCCTSLANTQRGEGRSEECVHSVCVV